MAKLKDARRPGFFWADNRIITEYGRKIGPAGIAVYCVLAMHAGSNRTAFPSYATVADRLGVSRRTVLRCVNVLRELELIEVTPPDPAKGRLCNTYRLVDPPQPGLFSWKEAAPGVVTPEHLGGDTTAPGVVTPEHLGGDTTAPGVVTPEHHEQYPLNNTHLTRPIEQDVGGDAAGRVRGNGSDSPDHGDAVSEPAPTPPAVGRQETGGKRSGKARTPPDRASGTAPTPPDTPCPRPAPRPRDALFDAVAEVTGADPNASGSYVGRVVKSLRSAEPPYTPEEVRRWAALVAAAPWWHGDPPTLGFLEKDIGRVRAGLGGRPRQMDARGLEAFLAKRGGPADGNGG